MALREIAQIALSDVFVTAWCALVVAYGLHWVNRHRVAVRRLATDIGQASDILEEFSRDTTALTEVEDRLQRLPQLGLLWRELTRGFLRPAGGPPVLTRDPERTFNAVAVWDRLIPGGARSGVASQLTALGILGTFLGLAAGIFTAQLGLTGGDLGGIQRSLADLLAGASLAFSTSIVGIGASLAFSMHERGQLAYLKMRLDVLCAQVAHVFPIRQPEQLTGDLLFAIREQSDRLDASVGRVVDTLDINVTQCIEDGTRQTLAVWRPMHENLDTLQANMREALAGIQGTLTNLASHADALEAQRSSRPDPAVPGDVLQAAVDEFRAAFRESAAADMDHLKLSIQGLQAALEASGKTYRKAAQEATESLTAAGETVRATTSQAGERLSDSIAGTVRTLAEVTEQLREVSYTGFVEALDKATRHVGASAQHIGKTLEHLTDGSQMATQALADAGNTSRELQRGVRQLSETLSQAGTELQSGTESLARLAANATKDLGVTLDCARGVREELDTATRNMATLTERVGRELHQVTDRFTAGMRTVAEDTGALRTSLETLGTSSSRLESATAPLAELTQGLTEVTERVAGLVGHSETVMAAIRTTAEHMQTTQGELSSRWSAYLEQMQSTDESLGDTLREAHGGMGRYLETLKSFTTEMDSQLAKGLAGLAGVVDELNHTVEEIPELLRTAG